VKLNTIKKFFVVGSLVLFIVVMPVIGLGCTETPTTGISATDLVSTLVPPEDLDLYIYINQGVPTTVPSSLTGTPVNIAVQSLAIWGILNNEKEYSISGVLTFTNAADASQIYGQLAGLQGLWTKLTDHTIYLVAGSGGPLESVRNAISTNTLKHYDNTEALAHIALFPKGETIKPGVIGVIKPTPPALALVKKYVGPQYQPRVDDFSAANPSLVVFGLFGSQPVDLTNMAQRIADNTVWDMDLGTIIVVSSGYPGFIVTPVFNRYLDNQGFAKVLIGDVTAYKYPLDAGRGKTVPTYINLSGNQLIVTASWQDVYAQKLMAGIKR
jgi:hypothetical protein